VTDWRVRWEGDLHADDHERLAGLLRAAFPGYAHAYPGRRTWAGARPELRVVGYDGAVPVAHAGALRRFVRIGDAELLVAVVGMVAVHPDRQGGGVGRVLGEHLAAALRALPVPFGMLGCGPDRVGFYRAIGWHLLPPTPVSYSPLDVDDASRVETHHDGWMVLPVTGTVEEWPGGAAQWHGAMI
jgi:nodulation protein A